MSREIPNFLTWCTEHGIQIDERLEIRQSSSSSSSSLLDGRSSMSVFSKSDTTIPIGESLVRIPKSSVLSVKNCSRSRDVPAGQGEPALELSLAFLIETFLGTESPWHGYFSSLPAEGADIAVFWGVRGDRDGVEAREWLEGTEAGKIISPPTGPLLLHRVDTYFETVAKGVLGSLKFPSLLEDFHRAYSIISSRAFLVDAYHGLCLVPVADAFNHIEDNHIHLESDYHVCPACGSLDECDHDIKTPVKLPNVGYQTDDTCEMVTNLPICPGHEVFNSYEKGLTNAELLCQYGFILDVNESNIVSWSVNELLDHATKPEEVHGLWARLISQWPTNPDWDDSQLVFNAGRDDVNSDSDDGVPAPRRANSTLLELNADGQISHHLWVFLYALVRWDADVGTLEAVLLEVKGHARAQERIERLERTVLDPYPLTFECRRSLSLLGQVAGKVIQFCDAKLASVHRTGASAIRIGELLDDLPAERRLTRLAMSYALEERRIIHACRGAWSEFAELVKLAYREHPSGALTSDSAQISRARPRSRRARSED